MQRPTSEQVLEAGDFDLKIAVHATALSARLSKLFLRDAAGHRPAFGTAKLLQHDPHFRGYLLFYEYFNGDDGRSLGASHQTGWTGLLARLLPTQP